MTKFGNYCVNGKSKKQSSSFATMMGSTSATTKGTSQHDGQFPAVNIISALTLSINGMAKTHKTNGEANQLFPSQ